MELWAQHNFALSTLSP